MEGGLHIDPKVASSQGKKIIIMQNTKCKFALLQVLFSNKIISRNTKKLIIEVNLKAKAL